MKVYVIYNATKDEFVTKREYCDGRKYMVYGDKRSASTMKTYLQRWEYKEDLLKVVEVEITKDMINNVR